MMSVKTLGRPGLKTRGCCWELSFPREGAGQEWIRAAPPFCVVGTSQLLDGFMYTLLPSVCQSRELCLKPAALSVDLGLVWGGIALAPPLR